MIDPIYRIGRADRLAGERNAEAGQSSGRAAGADPHGRKSKFSALMYATLKPPAVDLSDASGDDDDDASRPPMKAHVRPNLAKLMQEIDPSARPLATAQAAAGSRGRGAKDVG